MNEPIENAFKRVEDKVETFFGIPEMGESSRKALNIIEFIEREIGGVTLWPKERFVLKVFYGLPLNDADRKVQQWLKVNKGIEIHVGSSFSELVLAIGRRGGKSSLIAMIVNYEMYRMHLLEDPHSKFGLMPDIPIDILHCSASGEQAEELSEYIKATIRNTEYWEPWIDTIDKAREIRLFTRRNVKKGAKKGSLRIISKHSLSRTVRGYTAFVVIMDELAHFIDNRGNMSGAAMYKALTPSVKTFGKYGKIFSLSSPLGESGKFYDLSKQAIDIDSMLYVNYATWEFNPRITREDLDDEFKKDQEGAEMEYGARFGAKVAGFLPSDKIDEMLDGNLSIQLVGNPSRAYAVCVDPSKNLDRYAVVWGHLEWDMIKGAKEKVVIVDGIKLWEAKKFRNDDGSWGVKNVDIESVENFIINMKARRRFNIGVIAYDQYQSQSSIQKFQKMRMNAVETTFTSKYKELIYGTLKTCLITNTIRCFGRDAPDSDNLTIALAELKSLQRTLKGKTVHIGHPTVGRIKTDDISDCIANLSHLLITAGTPKGKMHAASHTKPMIARTSIG